jgi:ribokinase
MILCAGDILLDVFLLSELQASEQGSGVLLRAGGSAANTAHWLSQLGVPVRFVGCVGSDATGNALRQQLRDSGVQVAIRSEPGAETGAVVVEVGPHGERSMRSSRGANQALSSIDLREATSDDVRIIHLSCYATLGTEGLDILLNAGKLARDVGALLSVDPSSVGVIQRFGPDRFLQALLDAGAYLLLPNLHEATTISARESVDDAAQRLGSMFPKVVVKMGASGALVCNGGVSDLVPTTAAVPKDTTGAGDAFNAGVLAAVWRGESILEGCRTGHDVARRVVGQYGGG